MKRFFITALWILMVTGAFAQIDVRCVLANKEVLLYEPVLVTMQIINNTGEDLIVNGPKANASLDFEIEQDSGDLANPKGALLFPDGLMIPSRKTVVRRINLLNSYELRRAGPYDIRARVVWNGTAFLSPKVLLDVVPGIEIDRFAAGVPGGGGVRTSTLRMQQRERSDHLFIRIEDEGQGQCLGVYDLGPLVRLYKPRIQMDGAGNIHVLHQSGPWRYTHSVFSPDGVPVNRQYYTAELGDVGFEETGDGTVEIKGGGKYSGEPEIPPSDRDAEIPHDRTSKPVD
jgi:hypothetical protein